MRNREGSTDVQELPWSFSRSLEFRILSDRVEAIWSKNNINSNQPSLFVGFNRRNSLTHSSSWPYGEAAALFLIAEEVEEAIELLGWSLRIEKGTVLIMGYIANALYIIGNESGALEYFYERKRSCEVLESCVPPIKLLAEFKLAGNTRKAISSNVQSDY